MFSGIGDGMSEGCLLIDTRDFISFERSLDADLPHKPLIAMRVAPPKPSRANLRWEPRAIWLNSHHDPAGLEILRVRRKSMIRP